MSSNTTTRKLPPLKWLILFALILWLVMIMPPTAVAAWLAGKSAATWTAWSVLLSPVILAWVWHAVMRAKNTPRWITLQYLGLSAVLLPLIIPAGIASFFFPQKQVALFIVCLWLILVIAGIRAALRVSEKHLSLRSVKLDKPYRLVQLSDVHIGSRSTAFLEQVVGQVLTHSPEAVLITGDLLDLHHVGANELKPLLQIACPVFLCLGNHECYVDLDKAIHAIENCNVQVLRNQSVRHGELHIHGVDDQNNAQRVHDLLDNMDIPGNGFNILLYHRPDGWPAAIANGIDLTLAGHTHAGQIWPFGILVKRQFRHVAGYYEEQGQHLFVSQGTGTWGPTMRLGTRSEMTVIDLVPVGQAGT